MLFADYAGWSWARVLEEARRYEPAVAAFERRYLDEIEGIAEGAGVSAASILAVNVRTEIMFRARGQQAAGVAASECSSFVVLPPAAAGGKTFVGQNWDWLETCRDTVVVLEASPSDRPRFVTVVEAGLLAKTGLNAAGIGLATNALVTDRDAGRVGVPYHVLLRTILESSTWESAVATVTQASRACSANYIIAHEGGRALDLETMPGGASALHRLAPHDGLMVHTNHFLEPPVSARDISEVAMPNTESRLRHARLRSLLIDRAGAISPELLQSMLRDHENLPSSVCCHPDAGRDGRHCAATLASVIMDLQARRMWLADGRPCTSPYRQLDYAAFLT
jgi:isopenicillin-N N-acyltransferase-like protein